MKDFNRTCDKEVVVNEKKTKCSVRCKYYLFDCLFRGLYFALSGYGLATQPIAMKMEQQGPITLMCKKRIVLH